MTAKSSRKKAPTKKPPSKKKAPPKRKRSAKKDRVGLPPASLVETKDFEKEWKQSIPGLPVYTTQTLLTVPGEGDVPVFMIIAGRAGTSESWLSFESENDRDEWVETLAAVSRIAARKVEKALTGKATTLSSVRVGHSFEPAKVRTKGSDGASVRNLPTKQKPAKPSKVRTTEKRSSRKKAPTKAATKKSPPRRRKPTKAKAS